MATLAENVAKVVSAHGALKAAIAAKGVTLPQGVKLSDMPAIVGDLYTTPNTPGVSFFCQPITEFPSSPIVVDWSALESLAYFFEECTSLQSLTLPDGFGATATDFNECFFGCTSLQSLALPDGFGAAAASADECFTLCTALKNITGAIRFPVSFRLSHCTELTHDSLMNVLNGLVEVTGKTLTLGATNLAKLSDEEKAVATGKGWTLA